MNRISKINGVEMVLIPGGEGQIGSAAGYSEELPLVTNQIKEFYMDKYLVTNKAYKAYCDAVGKSYPASPSWEGYPDYFNNFPDYPVVNVSWWDATAYAAWAGKRLPTEEEWEYGARGGRLSVAYPWGHENPDGDKANYADRNTDFPWKDYLTSGGYRYTSTVGSYKANEYGLLDMAGNVWEWCDGWFHIYGSSEESAVDLNDGWGGSKVCRGGCYHSTSFDLRVSRRRQVLAGNHQDSVGFRCAMDVGGPSESLVKDSTRKQITSDLQVEREDNEVKLTLGMGMVTAEEAREIKRAGFDRVEQYVTWASVQPDNEEDWDFSEWDEQTDILKEAGLKWMPFLILGPAYSLPEWYRNSKDFKGLTCLEHNIESKIQSIWDKDVYGRVEDFLAKIAEHYNEKDVIGAVILGITGDFGESIFPVWHGNWPTQKAGLYHSHEGYWCNDTFARKDFVDQIRLKYKTVEALNETWQSEYTDLAELRFPELSVDRVEGFRVDEYTEAGLFTPKTPGDRLRWLDFVAWYRESMNIYSDFWLRTAAKYFAGRDVFLCTGGDATAPHGSNFAQQCKVAGANGCGVRITNEASNYPMNFLITNWVSSAAKHYKAFFGFEPAGQVTDKGILARVYNGAAVDADEVHFYTANIFGDAHKEEVFKDCVKHLTKGAVRRDVAALYPDTSIILGDVKNGVVRGNLELLRQYTDYRFVDDTTIKDGILDSVKVLVLCVGGYYLADTMKQIEKWVRDGGVLIGYNLERLDLVETDADYLKNLFDCTGGVKQLGKGSSLYITEKVEPQKDEIEGIVGASTKAMAYKKSFDYYQTHIFDKVNTFLADRACSVPNGYLNGLYTSVKNHQTLLLNINDDDVSTQITNTDGDITNAVICNNSIVRI